MHISFSCDHVPQPEQAPKTGLTAGADFGLKDFLTLSNGEKIAAPQPLNTELRHLRKAQRRLSRKQKGSNARTKARQAVGHWFTERSPTCGVIGTGNWPGNWSAGSTFSPLKRSTWKGCSSSGEGRLAILDSLIS